MKSNEIKHVLKGNTVTRSVFLDVYPVDRLPANPIQNDRWVLVVNCCPSNFQGEHWIAMFCEEGKINFFDSFGFSPVMYEGIVPFLRTQGWPNSVDVIFNDIKLQSIETDACGHYCILFAFFRAQFIDFKTILFQMHNISESTRDMIMKIIVSLL